MGGVGFGADSGANGSAGLISHTVEQNAVRAQLRGVLSEALNDFVYFAFRRHRIRPAARGAEVGDLVVLGVRRLQVDLHLLRRYRRPYAADNRDLRRRAPRESWQH